MKNKSTEVPFYIHSLDEDDFDSVLSVLKSPFLSTGPVTSRFESQFAELLSVKGAVACSSWTTAAFLVLKAWGIGPGDEVIVPALTFVATANIVEHCGARPIFVDVDTKNGNIDLQQVQSKITGRTKAVIPVHLYGNMVDMKALKAICAPNQIKILEDAAHCVEGTRDGYRPGQLGDAACFSFYATKNLTSGEGGAVASNDESLLEEVKMLRLHGMSKGAIDRYQGRYQHWNMSVVGYKANMSDIQSALMIHQIERLESLRERREEIARCYEASFKKEGIEFPSVDSSCVSARHLSTVWAPLGYRDEFLSKLQDAKIGVAVNFRSVHLMDYYAKTYGFRQGDLPVSETIGERTVSLPLYPSLTKAQIDHVKKSVIDAFHSLQLKKSA